MLKLVLMMQKQQQMCMCVSARVRARVRVCKRERGGNTIGVLLTFQERSWAMHFWIILAKAGVPCVPRALFAVVTTFFTSAGSTASHWKKMGVLYSWIGVSHKLAFYLKGADPYLNTEVTHMESSEAFFHRVCKSTSGGTHRQLQYIQKQYHQHFFHISPVPTFFLLVRCYSDALHVLVLPRENKWI